MNGVNKVILMGNLGKDPTIRYTQAGNAVANFSLACNEQRKDGDEYKEHVEWMRVAAFGRQAESIAHHLHKGDGVYVEGKLQTREYTDDQGIKRWSTDVIAHRVNFLPRSTGQGKPAEKKPAGEKKAEDPSFYDDDLPF